MSVEFHSPLLRPVAQNQASDSDNPFLSTTRIQPLSQASPLRQVFQTTAEMKTEFAKFLKTIFYQLDEKKVFLEMEKILADPTKTDEQIYKEILDRIDSMKRSFAPLRQLWALRVVKLGMARQAKELLKGFKAEKFQDYLEVYNRRYLDVMRKVAKLPLKGNTIAAADFPPNGTLPEKLEAGSLFFSFPFKQHVNLNDEDCLNPALESLKTCKPIGSDVSDKSVDLINVLGGLHHVPKERVEPFVQSLHRVVRPGAVVLLRDHDAGDENIKAIASAVHTFVNATAKVDWSEESSEIREFKSLDFYKDIMARNGFTCISSDALILKDDPTKNAMAAFVRQPQTNEELEEAISYRNDPVRPKQGTRATWIEWGNVRFSKQYAEYIQTKPGYGFDYTGHLRQHFKHFFTYIKECRKDKISWGELIFSSDMAMNLFILLAASIQCSVGMVVSIPSRMIARLRYGKDWEGKVEMSTLDRFDAKVEKEYSTFIDHTPFYMFPNLEKIKELWKMVLGAKEGVFSKISNLPGAFARTASLIMKSAISLPVRAIFTSEANLEPDKVAVLIDDPKDEIGEIQRQWSENRASQDADKNIEVVYSLETKRKYLLLPRYRPFSEIVQLIAQNSSISLIRIGGQESISLDVLSNAPVASEDLIPSARLVYTLPKLQDEKERHYATYQVSVKNLQNFVNALKEDSKIEYIHE
jgi:SAM-dependent methyltransferase